MKQYEAVIETLRIAHGIPRLHLHPYVVLYKTARKSFAFVQDCGLWRNIEVSWRIEVSWHKMQLIQIQSRCRNSIILIIRDFCCISVR